MSHQPAGCSLTRGYGAAWTLRAMLTLSLVLPPVPAFAVEPVFFDEALNVPLTCSPSSGDDPAPPSAGENSRSLNRSLRLDGRRLDYRVTAGKLVLRNAGRKPEASIFYTAYTVKPRGTEERPLTILFNGGPGESTMWLHMASVGPLKVDVDQPAQFAAPYRNNPLTLLDMTDLVFIDAMATGFSRPLGKADQQQFFGVDPDLNTFARAIDRYSSINRRRDSPKFLIGESYGSRRAAGLTYVLHERGIKLNGVVLVSASLSYENHIGDRGYIGLVPSYAAAAWFHGRVPRPPRLDAWLKQARAFAAGPYARALNLGADLPDEERKQIERDLARFTGLELAEV